MSKLLQILKSIPENVKSKIGKVKIFKVLYDSSKQELFYENQDKQIFQWNILKN